MQKFRLYKSAHPFSVLDEFRLHGLSWHSHSIFEKVQIIHLIMLLELRHTCANIDTFLGTVRALTTPFKLAKLVLRLLGNHLLLEIVRLLH